MDPDNLEIPIPEVLVNKYIKDFDGLPGGEHRDSVLELRKSVLEVQDAILSDPECLNQPDCMADFVKAMAIRMALEHHGIFYDA